ncbi:hypothetical protein ACFV5N_11440 [Streptomyces sp. NPDC059853]|uniref:hypothetical protein n=1 Tax=Streptomyces sp. NPDC059853 TaxID=3346973 RepID=UPI003654075E
MDAHGPWTDRPPGGTLAATGVAAGQLWPVVAGAVSVLVGRPRTAPGPAPLPLRETFLRRAAARGITATWDRTPTGTSRYAKRGYVFLGTATAAAPVIRLRT